MAMMFFLLRRRWSRLRENAGARNELTRRQWPPRVVFLRLDHCLESRNDVIRCRGHSRWGHGHAEIWCGEDLTALHREPPFWPGIVCSVPEAIDVDKEEQKACQAWQGQGSPQGICHDVGSARKTRRSARNAMGASHRKHHQLMVIRLDLLYLST